MPSGDPSRSRLAMETYVTDAQVRNHIWGPYYWVFLGTLQLFPFNKTDSWCRNFVQWLPSLFTVLVLLARVVYLMVRMNQVVALSLYWAYVTIWFFLSLHSLIGALALMTFKKSDYFNKCIELLRKATRDTVSLPSKCILATQLFAFAFMFAPALLSVVENFAMYDHDVTQLLANPNVTANETGLFRRSMFGENKYLFLVDAGILLWGTFVATCALLVYLLANRALCREYSVFNKDVKGLVEDGSITRIAVIRDVEARLIDFLTLGCFVTNTAAFLVDLTLMASLFMQISAQFALRAFAPTMESIQNTMCGVWTAQSIYLLLLATRKPAELQSLMTETTTTIWLDPGIWTHCDEPEVREVARAITQRIKDVDYASKGLTPTKAANLLVNAVLMVIPFFVHILAGYKYIPVYARQEA